MQQLSQLGTHCQISKALQGQNVDLPRGVGQGRGGWGGVGWGKVWGEVQGVGIPAGMETCSLGLEDA